MTRTTKILNAIYGLTTLFFMFDSLTSFDINSQPIKSFVYFGLLVGTPFTLIWNFLVIKTKTKRIIGTIVPTIILIFTLIIGPMKILFSVGAWRTQTILYQNEQLSFKTIELQMQNTGALGFNQRTVEVFYLTGFFMITSEVPINVDKSIEWIRVDKEVNELGLEFP